MNHDESQKKRPLSEISHLFLSSVREKQTNGSPRPQRIPPAPVAPPQPANVSIDMTPEEFARAFAPQAHGASDESDDTPRPQISALLGTHLNGQQVQRARDLARYLAGHGQRVAMIQIDPAELRVMCFEPAGGERIEDAEPTDGFDARQIREALEELNWDVDQWLLLLTAPRMREARELLQRIDHWVLMSTCDHDGIVGAYRTLKGLADVQHARLSLAVLDARDEQQAQRVYEKLSSVCRQFLGQSIEEQLCVPASADASENLVMHCRGRSNSTMPGPHWRIVSEFLAGATDADDEAIQPSPQDADPAPQGAPIETSIFTIHESDQAVSHVTQPTPAASPEPAREEPMVQMSIAQNSTPRQPAAPTLAMPPAAAGADDVAEVIDLPRLDASATTILDAVLHREGNELVECNLRPPMCPEARLAVTRDRRLTLLAVTSQGLGELSAIGQAYRWLMENRGLISMALPQMSIDPHSLPALRLLVDQADLRADALQPMLAAGQVTVQAYRRIRWGQRAGLLLEAA